MKLFQLSKYRDIFQSRSFRYFWVGFTVSNFGDAMRRVVLKAAFRHSG